MKKALLIVSGLVIMLSLATAAADFKPYPGAKKDEQATKEATEAAVEAKMPELKIIIYTTPDPFPKVAAFYKALAREFVAPKTSGTSGQPVKFEDEGKSYDLWEASFIFDEAKDLEDSRLWVKVQRPYIGDEVRDVTVIIVTEKTK